MPYQIVSFLLDVVAGLLAGACLLRAAMQFLRVGFQNPVGRFVFAVTDWIVLPLRKLLRPTGRWDFASLLAAWLIELAQVGILWSMFGALGNAAVLPAFALFMLLRLAISLASAIVIVYAILSWVRTDSPMTAVVERLAEPMLRPLRKIVPLVGGVDLSPFVLLVALQVAAMLLRGAAESWLPGFLLR